jgi:hypothetical protein
MYPSSPYPSEPHPTGPTSPPGHAEAGPPAPADPDANPRPPSDTDTSAAAASGSGSGDRLPGSSLTLGDFGPGRDNPLYATPAVTEDGDTVVVLDWSPLDLYMAEVWSQRHGEHAMFGWTRAHILADPVQAMAALRQAFALQAERARRWRTDHDTLTHRHQQVLSDIRAYAIARHREGAVCRDGLNDFLAEFALPRYEPRFKVTFTITGSYDLDPDDVDNDPDTARRDAEDHLAPDLSSLLPVIDGSTDYDVCVNDVDESFEPGTPSR